MNGFHHVPGFLSADEQLLLLDIARKVCAEAPLRRPSLPNGIPLKLTLTNCGTVGWWADKDGGYRYTDRHPITGKPWPIIPVELSAFAVRALGLFDLPAIRIDNCLINHYAEGESLGMHIDRTEQDKRAPIISLSIGADAEFT